MLYLNSPIIDSTASLIVVPVNLDGEIRKGTLAWELLQKYGAEYEYEVVEDIGRGLLRPGVPGIFQGGDDDRIFVNIVTGESSSWRDGRVVVKPVPCSEIINAMKEIVAYAAGSRQRSIAVPPLGPGMPWHLLENNCWFTELAQVDKGIEFWLYPEEDPEESKGDAIEFAEVTVNA